MAQTAASAKSFHVNGVDLAWSERGERPRGTPTLVLCHGYTGSAHDFALEVDALATDRRVVTLDQRGHGHSTKTGHLEGYTIDQLVSGPRWPSSRGWGRGPSTCWVIPWAGGWSWASSLARPDLVRSLILMDTSAWSFLPPDKEIRALVHGFINVVRPCGGHAHHAQHGRARGHPHRGAHAGRVAQGEGRHLRRHGPRTPSRHSAAS